MQGGHVVSLAILDNTGTTVLPPRVEWRQDGPLLNPGAERTRVRAVARGVGPSVASAPSTDQQLRLQRLPEGGRSGAVAVVEILGAA